MGFTPNEIRNQEFSKAFRGFSPTEVEAFKEAAATALEEAKVEVLKLSEERDSYRDRYRDLKELEETLKNVVVEAQRNAERLIENARKEAELIIAEAARRRDDIIEEKTRLVADLDSRVHEIEFTRRSFYSRLKAELEAHLKLMEQVYIPRISKKQETPQSISERDTQTIHTGNIQDDENIGQVVEQFRQGPEGGEEQ